MTDFGVGCIERMGVFRCSPLPGGAVYYDAYTPSWTDRGGSYAGRRRDIHRRAVPTGVRVR